MDAEIAVWRMACRASGKPGWRSRCARGFAGALALGGCSIGVSVAGPIAFNPSDLVLDATPIKLDGFFRDKIADKAIFSKNGQNAWAGGAAQGPSPVHDFKGFEPSIPTFTLGGITSVCDPTPLGLGCADFGARVRISGGGKFGIDYGLSASAGTLDIRYPVGITLDLPYGPGGAASAPHMGEPFTIGSSWGLQTFKSLSSPPSPSKVIAPQLAAHGPTLQAFVDAIGEGHLTVDGKLCAAECIGDSATANFPGKLEVLAVNRNGDGEIRVLGQEVSTNESDGALVNYKLKVPKLDAKGGQSGAAALAAGAQDLIASLGLNIDGILSAAIGFPLADEFSINIAGESLGVKYALLEADANLNMLIAQSFGFSAAPVIELAFGSPVLQKLADGSFGAPTTSIVFNAGDSVTLRAPGALMLGVIPTYSLFGGATNRTDLKLEGQLSVSALKVQTPIGDKGPLFDPDPLTLNIGTLPLADASFLVDMQKVTGTPFNMGFLPVDTVQAADSQKVAVALWDGGQWLPEPGSAPCSGIPACSLLAQNKVLGFYGFDGNPLAFTDPDGNPVDCLTNPLSCDEDLIVDQIDIQPVAQNLFFGTPRVLAEDGGDLLLDDLLALAEPQVDPQPGATREELDANLAALAQRFGRQTLRVPGESVPEPGTAALLAVALGSLLALRRARVAPRSLGIRKRS